MRYDISLTIAYTYAQASDNARSLIRLLPLNIPGQQDVRASVLTVDPVPQERWDGFDFFGNQSTWITFLEPIDGFTLNLRTQVRRYLPSPQMDLSTGLGMLGQDIASVHSVRSVSPHHFLGPSPRVAPEPEMTAFARDHTQPDMSAMQAAVAVGEALHREMAFDSEATDVLTPTGEAFAQRRGVCQDFTHVMIACLRGLGIPAGYVSGFLRTVPPPGQERLEGADAMHAWVRIWCGREIGWVEYDPTNAILVGDGHVVVAYGRDYADVSPVRGTMRSTGDHHTEQSVDVVPVELEDQSEPA